MYIYWFSGDSINIFTSTFDIISFWSNCNYTSLAFITHMNSSFYSFTVFDKLNNENENPDDSDFARFGGPHGHSGK